VLLWTWSPHAAMLNQAAARKFGVRPSDPPPLGGWFGKDMKSRQWDGAVHQGAWFRIFQTLMNDRAGEQAKLRRFLDCEAQWGVTSISIMEIEPARRVELLSTIDSPMRVRLVPFLPFQEQNRRLKPEYPPVPASIVDRVTVSGVKWLLDGSPIERSAAMRAPYTDDPATSGQLDFPPEELRGILREALQRNAQPLLHATGDRTTEALLNEIEATGGEGPAPGHNGACVSSMATASCRISSRAPRSSASSWWKIPRISRLANCFSAVMVPRGPQPSSTSARSLMLAYRS
jgi:predicted amidohydrolase YtcJ